MEGRWMVAAACVTTLLVQPGCFRFAEDEGGGQLDKSPDRRSIAPSDIAVPVGYRVELVARGFTFPTGVAFDDQGRVYVVEAGYSYGEVFTTPRLLRIDDGQPVEVARGGHPPWTGVSFHDGAFYVAEGGELNGGRIVRVTAGGDIEPLVSGLPGLGDHHTDGPVVGPDGWIYFGQGTATNSGVVGPDNYDFGWLARHPEFHDTPCRDVTLTGTNFESANPLTAADDRVVTGGFVPFGTATRRGQVIEGAVPCSGAIMKIRPAGGEPELVAWGFRNPFGLAFANDGALYVTDNGFDVRGSRPIFGAADLLWKIEPGTWYGWPDFSGGVPLSNEDFHRDDDATRTPLIADPPNPPPRPVASFAVHSSSNGIDVAPETFGYGGQAFVAQFGDQAPTVGKVMAPVGFKVVRVDLSSGVIQDFARNREQGPASLTGGGGLERPVSVRFHPDGRSLYVVDFGIMTMSEQGANPRKGSGVLWRITREP